MVGFVQIIGIIFEKKIKKITNICLFYYSVLWQILKAKKNRKFHYEKLKSIYYGDFN